MRTRVVHHSRTEAFTWRRASSKRHSSGLLKTRVRAFTCTWEPAPPPSDVMRMRERYEQNPRRKCTARCRTSRSVFLCVIAGGWDTVVGWEQGWACHAEVSGSDQVPILECGSSVSSSCASILKIHVTENAETSLRCVSEEHYSTPVPQYYST